MLLIHELQRNWTSKFAENLFCTFAENLEIGKGWANPIHHLYIETNKRSIVAHLWIELIWILLTNGRLLSWSLKFLRKYKFRQGCCFLFLNKYLLRLSDSHAHTFSPIVICSLRRNTREKAIPGSNKHIWSWISW